MLMAIALVLNRQLFAGIARNFSCQSSPVLGFFTIDLSNPITSLQTCLSRYRVRTNRAQSIAVGGNAAERKAQNNKDEQRQQEVVERPRKVGQHPVAQTGGTKLHVLRRDLNNGTIIFDNRSVMVDSVCFDRTLIAIDIPFDP